MFSQGEFGLNLGKHGQNFRKLFEGFRSERKCGLEGPPDSQLIERPSRTMNDIFKGKIDKLSAR